jgi:hypothetical protein
VLPAEVGGLAVGEVIKLVLPTTEDPDWVTVFAIYEGENGKVATGDEIIAIVGL